MNTMWAIDDFTEANGATHVVPGSHRWVDRSPAVDEPSRVQAAMPAGSLMFFLGSVFHGGLELMLGLRKTVMQVQ